MVDDVAFPAIVALVAAAALTALGRWLALGRLRTLIAALAGGALVALSAAEFMVSGSGDWWQRHPSTGAVVTGLLLLALTVLVVEAAVQRALKAAEEKRWRPAGQVAANQLLAGIAAPIRDFQDQIIWVMGERVENAMRSSPGEEPGERARLFAEQVSDVVLRAAPVLSATEQLHAVYAHALKVAQIASELSLTIPEWEREHADNISVPTVASESARLAWWAGVGVPWQRLVEAAKAFEEDAWGQLGAFVEDQPWSPPWREQPLKRYGSALDEYLEEYGAASAADVRKQ